MPILIAAIIAALAAGGSLVPHASGGLIVNAAGGGGYVTSTYLTTASVASIAALATASAGSLVVALTGIPAAIWGSAGVFGTTIGATGIKGALMSAGLISATPLWVPAAIGGTAVAGVGGISYLLYYLMRLRKKSALVLPGREAQFSDREAALIERLLLALHSKGKLGDLD